MNIEAIRQAYNENPAVTAICDEMAGRANRQSETKLRRIRARLANAGNEIRKRDAIAAFRILQDCECGEYVVGRHGWPSRFVWSVNSLDACRAAQGNVEVVDPLPDFNDEDDVEHEVDSITHALRLRDDFDVEIELPDDLTIRESERLQAFISSLPIDE